MRTHDNVIEGSNKPWGCRIGSHSGRKNVETRLRHYETIKFPGRCTVFIQEKVEVWDCVQCGKTMVRSFTETGVINE